MLAVSQTRTVCMLYIVKRIFDWRFGDVAYDARSQRSPSIVPRANNHQSTGKTLTYGIPRPLSNTQRPIPES